MRRLRCLRAGLPRRGDLLRRRPARQVGRLLQGQRRVLRRDRLARRRGQGRRDRQGPPGHRGAAAPGRRRTRSRLAWRSTCPTSPGTPWLPSRGDRASARPAASSTSRSARPSTRRPAVVRDALARRDRRARLPAGRPAPRPSAPRSSSGTRGAAASPASATPTCCRRSARKSSSRGMALWLGLGPGDTVVYPRTPTRPTRSAPPSSARRPSPPTTPPSGRESTKLVWLNSPGNPDGRVLVVERSARRRRPGPRARCRHRGRRVLRRTRLGRRVADDPTPCILDPRVVGDSRRASSRSTRCQQAVEPRRLPRRVRRRLRRRHRRSCSPCGSTPVSCRRRPCSRPWSPRSATTRTSPSRRRATARAATGSAAALDGAGFRIDHSEAGLYLWATRGEDAWATVAWLAERGHPRRARVVLRGDRRTHVRIALTATDERIDAAAVARLEPSAAPAPRAASGLAY